MVYYNEFDAKKAAWLRELIARNLIAQGVVDERSIRDVQPGDLRGYRQCHFFAGIGIWSYALRLAGWPDNRPVWTASCPCQPFSAAGKRQGTADERHLWPEVARLVEGVRPVVLFGEQVAGRDGLAWLDDVCDDLERGAYTPRALIAPACGFGAPHRRERLYWCALSDTEGRGRGERWHASFEGGSRHADGGCKPDGVADHAVIGREWGRPSKKGGWAGKPERLRDAGSVGYAELSERWPGEWEPSGHRRETGRDESANRHCGASKAGSLGDAVLATGERDGRELPGAQAAGSGKGYPDGGLYHRLRDAGATRGAWAGADWVLARPQRVGDPPSLRPVKSSAQRLANGDTGGMVRGRNSGFPLAEGEEARTLRLKGYGDAIVSAQAAAFISAVMEEIG